MTQSRSMSLATAICLSKPLNRIALVAAILILMTSSFDIFLILEAGGNYRFCQMIAPVLIILASIRWVRGAKLPVVGLLALCLWGCFQVLFIPTTDYWPKSVGYCLWLLLNVALVFSFVQLFGDDITRLSIIVRWYLYSFAVVAAFGVVQFCLPLLGFEGLLVKQWWIQDVLPRANGFSYEPSYFATYLMIGFVLTGSLRRSHSHIVSRKALLAIYWITAIGIFLSSSRMGIFFLFVDIFLSQIRPWLSFLSDVVRFRIAPAKARALVPSLVSVAVLLVIATGTSIAVKKNPTLALMFLNGTGISDTAAHSVIQREDSLEETMTVFLEHPLIGRSLGGVSSAIAKLHGEEIHSFEASKDFEGMSVFAEVLAASGIIGAIPFVWFLIATFRMPLRLARATSPFYSKILYGLLRSLAFAWAILQFNQNLLRPYLWTHIAVLATVYAAAVQSVKAPAVLRKC